MSRYRLWAFHAVSAQLAGELTFGASSTFASRFGGAASDVSVSVGHLHDGDPRFPDWEAAERVVGWLTPLRFTLVLTQGTHTVGEWLVRRTAPVTAGGIVGVQAMEWDGYPALRSTNDDYIYDDVDQLTIARILLVDAFRSFQSTMVMSVPTQTSGVTRELDYLSHEAYYSDLLEEISSPDDGFDWRVRSEAQWSGGQPTHLTRTVEFGHPIMQRPSPIVIRHDGPGATTGNAKLFEQARDGARLAQSVYGFGAGEGTKARRGWVGLSDPSGTNAGDLVTTKNVSFPSVKKRSTLTSRTRGELALAQDSREPMKAQLLTEDIAAFPQVGDWVRMEIARNYSMPDGFTGQARLGEVKLRLDGDRSAFVDVQAL